jgi:hypothetical protein
VGLVEPACAMSSSSVTVDGGKVQANGPATGPSGLPMDEAVRVNIIAWLVGGFETSYGGRLQGQKAASHALALDYYMSEG